MWSRTLGHWEVWTNDWRSSTDRESSPEKNHKLRLQTWPIFSLPEVYSEEAAFTSTCQNLCWREREQKDFWHTIYNGNTSTVHWCWQKILKFSHLSCFFNFIATCFWTLVICLMVMIRDCCWLNVFMTRTTLPTVLMSNGSDHFQTFPSTHRWSSCKSNVYNITIMNSLMQTQILSKKSRLHREIFWMITVM